MSESRLDIRIQEIGLNECKDYPNIESQDSFGHLWAIEQTLEGRRLAITDLHARITELEQENQRLKVTLQKVIDALEDLANDIGEEECFSELELVKTARAIAQNKE